MNRAEKRRQKKLAQKAAKISRSTRSSVAEQLQAAITHHGSGRLEDAERGYRLLLEAEPGQPDALHLLGVIAHQSGNHEAAIALIDQAIAARPIFAEAFSNKASAYRELEQFEAAIDTYQIAIEQKPEFADARYNLGSLLQSQNRLDEAISHYEETLTLRPDFVEAHFNLGNAKKDQNKLDEAIPYYQTVVSLLPDHAEAYNNLGITLRGLDRLAEAIDSFRTALDLNPVYADAHYNLGDLMRHIMDLEAALESLKRCLALKPEHAEACNSLGMVYQAIGDQKQAEHYYRKSMAIDPSFVKAHSNLLFLAHYLPGSTHQSLHQLHRSWDLKHARPYQSCWQEHTNAKDPNRKIRIGFVSPDLGRHPIGYFVIGLFKHLNNSQFEIICFSDRNPDDQTETIRQASGEWHDTRGIDNDGLYDLIRQKSIDVLIDLAGHSANNRLIVFARKPAPVQVAWAGYVGTTGLSAMDYLISDRYSTRTDEDQFYEEELLRMPDGWLCYTPPDYAPAVGPVPSITNKTVTFGSFNNPSKLNEQLIGVWSNVLHNAPSSRLLLKYRGIDHPYNISRLEKLFQTNGIDSSRVIYEGWSPHEELLARYHTVDIALDPIPYSGGLTTYEALWMGVPVITMPGSTFASRHSESHLQALGLPDLVAHNHNDYVNLAVKMANSPDILSSMRNDLRPRMEASSICDYAKFSDEFGRLMRRVWRVWCRR